MKNEAFTIGKTSYQVTRVDDLAGFESLKKNLLITGKEPKLYHASKVLKSGKLSERQGGIFYKFKSSGNFLKI